MSLFWPGLQAGGYWFQWMHRLLGRATFVQHVWRGEERCSGLVALMGDVSKAQKIFIYASRLLECRWIHGANLVGAVWPELEVFRFLQL